MVQNLGRGVLYVDGQELVRDTPSDSQPLYHGSTLQIGKLYMYFMLPKEHVAQLGERAFLPASIRAMRRDSLRDPAAAGASPEAERANVAQPSAGNVDSKGGTARKVLNPTPHSWRTLIAAGSLCVPPYTQLLIRELHECVAKLFPELDTQGALGSMHATKSSMLSGNVKFRRSPIMRASSVAPEARHLLRPREDGR